MAPLAGTTASLVVLLIGAGLAAGAARALAARRADARAGRLIAVDAGTPATLVSSRFRMRGRPDALRALPDGRVVPVEVKSRVAPPLGPPVSHLVQVWAYCLLVEETTGRPPPFGLLRYADREFRVRWDGAARSELLRRRAEVARPYDGRSTPSPGRCARCPWSAVCDVRARGAGPRRYAQ